ncbi:MAG: GC-type dockerin domain-anchored protein [Phycisphaerales bacterium]
MPWYPLGMACSTNRVCQYIGPGTILAGYLGIVGPVVSVAQAQQKLHFTYLWHLEQPIYWPDRQASGQDRYEVAWGSILRKDAGAVHPSNNLRDIFGLADRVAAYQYRCRDAVNSIRWTNEGGAQISYSGGLIENISSLGNANQLGYSSGWYNSLREARGWSTTIGTSVPRCDLVIFPFHHALMPLLDESAMRKEIQLYKSIYPDAWGAGVPQSVGFFPSEMAFTERMIPVLASEGIQWSIVSAEKISRACADFPVVYGSGGINCDPPNLADKINPAQGASGYYRQSIDRGCAPAEAYPFALTPRRAQHVDPATGVISSIIVVPASQSLGWKDGYAPIGTSYFDQLNTRNDPNRPMLVVLAHDGDNAWGGGFSYYQEATPNLVSSANGAGYVPTVVQRYLSDHPVPANDFVHVEDGAWVNADGDFGSPQFLNWNWPPVNASGQVDIANGWAEDIRNWAIIVAAQNRVDTAEQIWTDPIVMGGSGGSVNVRKILYPDGSTNAVERAWHYFLGSLNSGYMYYGTAEDFEVKPTIACNEALRLTSPVIGSGTNDRTPPTVWIPQRFPWNPGSTNFGPAHGYQQVVNNGDFWIWTFADDVSGVTSVTMKYRLDADGQNPLSSTQNETYVGGPEVGAWQSLAMTRRAFPAGNIFNSPTIDFFEMPQAIADQYSVQLTGIRSALVDYYVEAMDSRGNVRKSAIQHVYVGDGQGAIGGGGPAVAISPATPTAGQSVTVTYDPAGRVLAGASQVTMHWGVNTWTQVTDTPMIASVGADAGTWLATVTIPSGNTTQLDLVFNNTQGTWDNNNGQDWHYAVTPGGGGGAMWVMDGVRDASAMLVGNNSGVSLWAGLIGDDLYVASKDAGEGNDHFIFVAPLAGPGVLRASSWAKAGQVATWAAFLADENDNDYESWFDHGSARVGAMTGANGGVLEGTINLRDLFALGSSPLPEAVWLAFGAYPTADGSSLISGAQIGPSLDSNTMLNANEFVRVELCTLDPALCAPACVADVDNGTGTGTPDGGVTIDDLLYYLTTFNTGSISADVDDGTGTGSPDGGVTIDDLLYFLTRFNAGC